MAGVVVLAPGIWLNNSSWLSNRPAGVPQVLAHRGLAQDFDPTGLGPDTCAASRMAPPRHAYLENTIASMDAAFALGADALELDVHPTTDGRFAVFHDWTLNCRTDGKDETRSHSMAELKALDIELWLHGGWRQDLSVSRQGCRHDAFAGRGFVTFPGPAVQHQRQRMFICLGLTPAAVFPRASTIPSS